MTSDRILIIEGNPNLRSLLGWHLQQAGYWICHSDDIDSAKEKCYKSQANLVIVEAELHSGNSFEFCEWLQQHQDILILMLSERKTEADIVAGLKAGADDYLAKPFGLQEFLARVEALLRRQRKLNPVFGLDYGDLRIDLVQRRVRFKGILVDLTPQEFSLLYVLAQAGGVPLSRSELLQKAWPNSIDNPRTIDTHVLSLRKKIDINPREPSLIETVRSVGYRFNQEKLTGSELNNSQKNQAASV